MSIERHDHLETHCRNLGHAVPFSYCRSMNETLPCRAILDCWYTQVDASGFLRDHFTADQVDRILAPPKPKLTSLLELIERARAGSSS